jgi:hypothetical protein
MRWRASTELSLTPETSFARSGGLSGRVGLAGGLDGWHCRRIRSWRDSRGKRLPTLLVRRMVRKWPGDPSKTPGQIAVSHSIIRRWRDGRVVEGSGLESQDE